MSIFSKLFGIKNKPAQDAPDAAPKTQAKEVKTPKNKEESLSAQIDGEIDKLPHSFAQLKDPSSREKIKSLAQKMSRDGVDLKSASQVKKWIKEHKDEVSGGQTPSTVHREEPKHGRNEPCPCGSGKKYKKCCGKN